MSTSQTVSKRLAALKLREQQEQERDKQRKREAEARSREIAELEKNEREEEENRRKAEEEEKRWKQAEEAERRKMEIEVAVPTRLMKPKRKVTLKEPQPCDRCIANNQACVRPQGRKSCTGCRSVKRGCTISQDPLDIATLARMFLEDEDDEDDEEEEEERASKQRKTGNIHVPQLEGDSISAEALRNLTSTMERIAEIQDRQLVVLEDMACTQRTLQLLAGDDPRWRKLSELEPKDRNLHHILNILRTRKRKRSDGKSTLEDHWGGER